MAVQSSPWLRRPRGVPAVMGHVLLALLPGTAVAVWVWGPGPRTRVQGISRAMSAVCVKIFKSAAKPTEETRPIAALKRGRWTLGAVCYPRP